MFLMLLLAGVLGSACNKETTPAPEPTSMSQVDSEEMARIREDKQRMKQELEARERKQAQWEEETAKKNAEDKAMADKLNYVKVTVIDGSAMSGCSWVLQLDNGKQVVPEEVPLAYREQGRQLWVKYTKSNEPTTCGISKAVRLLDVQFRNPAGG